MAGQVLTECVLWPDFGEQDEYDTVSVLTGLEDQHLVADGSKCGEHIEKEMTGCCGNLVRGPVQPEKMGEVSWWGCCLA